MSTVVPLFLCVVSGCTSTGGFAPPWKKPQAKQEGPKDAFVMTGGGMERIVVDDATRQEFDTARRLFDEKKYAQAEPMFHKLVKLNREPAWWEFGLLAPRDDTKQGRSRRGDPLSEAALFYEAECQRLQKNYRGAVDTYTKLLVEFSSTQYTSRSCMGLFEIANYWLQSTGRQMDEYHAQLKGERWFVTPGMYVHFSKDMPLLDPEGHATQILNTVRVHDGKGPLAEKALMMLGTISFFRKDYKDADFYFSQLHEQFPESKEAPRAIKQSIICKQLSTGGTVYDLRPVEESKKLLMVKQAAYQELANDKDWVEGQLKMMNVQQADRDFKIAEFYQRTGHPGSAYFYYELVCRRYPGSTYATQAAQRKLELRRRMERDQGNQNPTPAVEPGPAPPRTLPPLNPRN